MCGMRRAGEQAGEIQETLEAIKNILENRAWGAHPRHNVVNVMSRLPPLVQEMQRALVAMDMTHQLQGELVALRSILAAGLAGAEVPA
jgi:hypothetical protein